MIFAAFCAACAGEPPVPPRPPAPPPAGEVPRLYNDYLRRLPCPEPAICGTGPEMSVSAVRCHPSPEPDDRRCVFLVSVPAQASDQVHRCEGAFSRRDGAWTMTKFAEPCRLVGERDRARFRLAEVPSRRTIEAIESGFALQEDLMAVGVVDSEEMNRNSRVKVRRVSCTPSEGAALCSYEANRCLDGERDEDGDGWCRRKARYQIAVGIDHSLTVSRGWTIDRPAGER